MRLKKGYKNNLDLLMLSRCLSIFLSVLPVLIPFTIFASPTDTLPPASFTYVDETTDGKLLIELGLDGAQGAWCYDNHANAVLITAPARERAQCELKAQYDLEKQKVKYQFNIDKLNLKIKSLNEQYEKIYLIKDNEINKLTEAALKRPNNYMPWIAGGSFIAGVGTTILVFMLVK